MKGQFISQLPNHILSVKKGIGKKIHVIIILKYLKNVGGNSCQI